MRKLYLCLPLAANISKPKNADWKKTTCVICGCECWESEEARKMLQAGVVHSCTACALKAGWNNGE